MNDLTSAWEYPFAKKIEALEKHIAELEAILDEICNTLEAEPESKLNIYLFKLADISEGGGEVLDERYFCVCGEPVYAGEISCLKCGTPRPAYTRHPSKSEGGTDE